MNNIFFNTKRCIPNKGSPDYDGHWIKTRIETCDEQPDHYKVHTSETSHSFSTNYASIESLYFYLHYDNSIIRINVEFQKQKNLKHIFSLLFFDQKFRTRSQ